MGKYALRSILSGVGALVVLFGAWAAYAVGTSPAAIRQPAYEHYHFRMQIVVNGKVEHLGHKKYQSPAYQGACTADLATEPIHLHDNKDQIVHIHWNGITGGLVLKNYGWNYVGGPDRMLGYRTDHLPDLWPVPIYGTVLPPIPRNATFHVYTGDETTYRERSFAEFRGKDLEDFFGKHSNLPGNEPNKQHGWLDKLFPKAAAHAQNGVHRHTGDDPRLMQLHNLLGNVVVFVQKEKPTAAQVKERFRQLEPLSDSVCGG